MSKQGMKKELWKAERNAESRWKRGRMAEGEVWRAKCDVIIRVGGVMRARSGGDKGPVISEVERAEKDKGVRNQG